MRMQLTTGPRHRDTGGVRACTCLGGHWLSCHLRPVKRLLCTAGTRARHQRSRHSQAGAGTLLGMSSWCLVGQVFQEPAGPAAGQLVLAVWPAVGDLGGGLRGALQ